MNKVAQQNIATLYRTGIADRIIKYDIDNLGNYVCNHLTVVQKITDIEKLFQYARSVIRVYKLKGNIAGVVEHFYPSHPMLREVIYQCLNDFIEEKYFDKFTGIYFTNRREENPPILKTIYAMMHLPPERKETTYVFAGDIKEYANFINTHCEFFETCMVTNIDKIIHGIPAGTVIYIYGSGSSRKDYRYFVNRAREAGLRVENIT